jgi:hypothetical protein
MKNQTIETLINAGLSLEQALEGYAIYGDFPDLILNYICDNY